MIYLNSMLFIIQIFVKKQDGTGYKTSRFHPVSQLGLQCVGLVYKSGKINVIFRKDLFLVGSGVKGTIHVQTSTGRNQFTDNNVFLQSDKMVDLALDGSIGKDLCGLLEGCSRQEAVGLVEPGLSTRTLRII